MACRCAPSLLKARDELTAVFPDRGRLSDGCCPSPAHTAANPTSDHEPNAQGFARAYDFDERIGPGQSPLMPLKDHLLKDPRTKYVIYEAVLYYPDGSKRASKGHDKHLHLSIKNEAVSDTRSWNIASAFKATGQPAPTEPPPEDYMLKLIRTIDAGDAENLKVYAVGPGYARWITEEEFYAGNGVLWDAKVIALVNTRQRDVLLNDVVNGSGKR